MRVLIVSAAVLAAAGLAASAAQAQGDGLAGVWAFQTEPYGNPQFAVSMSGAAVIGGHGRTGYSIEMTSNELIVDQSSGRARIITAHQACTGARDGAQISVSCEMAEPLDGYTPDNFLLQANEGQLAGVINGSSQVTFARVR